MDEASDVVREDENPSSVTWGQVGPETAGAFNRSDFGGWGRRVEPGGWGQQAGQGGWGQQTESGGWGQRAEPGELGRTNEERRTNEDTNLQDANQNLEPQVQKSTSFVVEVCADLTTSSISRRSS